MMGGIWDWTRFVFRLFSSFGDCALFLASFRHHNLVAVVLGRDISVVPCGIQPLLTSVHVVIRITNGRNSME